jgi:hypothetical protein
VPLEQNGQLHLAPSALRRPQRQQKDPAPSLRYQRSHGRARVHPRQQAATPDSLRRRPEKVLRPRCLQPTTRCETQPRWQRDRVQGLPPPRPQMHPSHCREHARLQKLAHPAAPQPCPAARPPPRIPRKPVQTQKHRPPGPDVVSRWRTPRETGLSEGAVRHRGRPPGQREEGMAAWRCVSSRRQRGYPRALYLLLCSGSSH